MKKDNKSMMLVALAILVLLWAISAACVIQDPVATGAATLMATVTVEE